jgi:hypothetical protein
MGSSHFLLLIPNANKQKVLCIDSWHFVDVCSLFRLPPAYHVRVAYDSASSVVLHKAPCRLPVGTHHHDSRHTPLRHGSQQEDCSPLLRPVEPAVQCRYVDKVHVVSEEGQASPVT